MPDKRKITVILFVLVALAWVFVLLHGTLGFVPNDDSHAVFVNVLHGLVWAAFLYAGWRLCASFRGTPGATP